MYLIYQFIFSFFATVGFAVFFNAPFDSIIPSGIAGGLSWSLYYMIYKNLGQKVIGALCGAFLVGFLGEILAVKLKKPATVFITPGIIPLVPGAGMYYTMLYLVEKDFEMVATHGSETFFIAASIAIGIIASNLLFRTIKILIKFH